MLKFFQICIPFATNVMGSAVEKYGFEPTQTGVPIYFHHLINVLMTVLPRLHAVSEEFIPI